MKMKEQCHTSYSPALAKELNANGMKVVRRHEQKDGDDDDDDNIDNSSNNTNNIILALRLHRKALSIFEWNKRNALLYDHVEQSMEYAVEMACTLSVIGGLLRRMNDFVGAAEVYKECLDNFLVGLITGGDVLKRKLLESEFNTTTSASNTTAGVFEGVDRHSIGKALCYHPEFRRVAHNISRLVCEIQCIKFVGGQNAASSRRRRHMIQYAAREENLKNAAKSLNMTSSSLRALENHTKQGNHVCLTNGGTNHIFLRSQSLPNASTTTTSQFWEKPAGQARTVSCNRPRPPPLLRRALTSDEEYDQYKSLSDMITPVETRLLAALNRFPLPVGIVEDYTSTPMSQCSTSSSTVVEDGALAPSQITTCDHDDSREGSQKSHQSQNPIEVETSFPFSSMAFVPMNLNNGTTSSVVNENLLAPQISEKLRVSVPLLC